MALSIFLLIVLVALTVYVCYLTATNHAASTRQRLLAAAYVLLGLNLVVAPSFPMSVVGLVSVMIGMILAGNTLAAEYGL